VLVRVHPPDAHSQIPQPSHPPRRYPRPEDAAPACPWKSRAVQTHRTRSFRYCATCGARCDARACVPKSVTVEPSRGPENSYTRPGTQGRRVYFSFFDVTLFPDSKNIYAPLPFGVGGVFRNSQTKSTST
jgi:hypothetical protein